MEPNIFNFLTLEHLLYFALVYILVCILLYIPMYLKPITCRVFRLLNLIKLEYFKWPAKASMKRVLIITSHPDDECMFFGPVILSIVQNLKSNIYLLCLSHGNFENQVSADTERVTILMFYFFARVLKESKSYGMHVKS